MTPEGVRAFDAWAASRPDLPIQEHEFGRYDSERACARAAWQAGYSRGVSDERERLRTLASEVPPTAEDCGIMLFGCCDYEDVWEPGIKEWGATDQESRAKGYITVPEYDRLLAKFNTLAAAIRSQEGSKNGTIVHLTQQTRSADNEGQP